MNIHEGKGEDHNRNTCSLHNLGSGPLWLPVGVQEFQPGLLHIQAKIQEQHIESSYIQAPR